jgi:type III restriction enzyme
MVKHLLSYLSEGDARNVLIYHQKPTHRVHARADAGAPLGEGNQGYDVVVSKGFTELKASAFTTAAN